jgi:23S rRNA pseudouridine2605 synthase
MKPERSRRASAPARRVTASEPLRAVSLERALSKLGLASRTAARAMIAGGHVSVGGRVVTDPARRVDPARDVIAVDGERVLGASFEHWMLHKPTGYVTTRRDPQGRPTVHDLLPAGLPHLGAVGRLDLDSSGLLILTNETHLAAALTDPRSHVEKVYEVRLDAPVDAAAAQMLATGVDVQGVKTRPARVELRTPGRSARLRVTLVEGRNRQVRRMCAVVGREVLELHRVAVGPLQLGALAAGMSRRLTAAEVGALRAAVGLSLRRGARRGANRARPRET